MSFKIIQEFDEYKSINAKHHLRPNVRFFIEESNIEIFVNNPDEVEEYYLVSYEFVDLEGDRVYVWRDDKVRVEIEIEVPKTELEYEYVDFENIQNQKYKDFENGEYIAIVLDVYSLNFSNETFIRHNTLTVLGGCFGFDVEGRKIIIGLIRLPDFIKTNKPWEVTK